MDARLFKALTENRIAIVRILTRTKPQATDDADLLDRCRNLSFQDTEKTIRALEQSDGPPTGRKTNWFARLLRRFGSNG